jgi:hypothetical protein
MRETDDALRGGVVVDGAGDVVVEGVEGDSGDDGDVEVDTLGLGAFLVGDADVDVDGEGFDEDFVHGGGLRLGRVVRAMASLAEGIRKGVAGGRRGPGR